MEIASQSLQTPDGVVVAAGGLVVDEALVEDATVEDVVAGVQTHLALQP